MISFVVGHGIIPYLHTFYAAPIVEHGKLTAIIIEYKNGRGAIRGRQFIDATGDADLALHLQLPSFGRKRFSRPLRAPRSRDSTRSETSIGNRPFANTE